MTAAEDFEQRGKGKLPGLLGIEVVDAEPGAGRTTLRLPVKPELLAPNGYLHAAAVVALADTAAGYGCVLSLPDGARGFTTIELKSNFMGTATAGEVIACRSWLVHGGRSTQVWDAEVADGSGRVLALFRCTQMVLYPKPAPAAAR